MVPWRQGLRRARQDLAAPAPQRIGVRSIHRRVGTAGRRGQYSSATTSSSSGAYRTYTRPARPLPRHSKWFS